jgi:RimJ/RimL family protein N-acetyltransferase
VTLRKMTARDAPWLVKWRNANAEFFPPQEKLTLASHMRWYNMVYLTDPTDHMYVVESKGRAVGTLSVNIQTSVIGRVILGDREHAEPGAMKKALVELMNIYGKPEYYLQVLPDNERAIRFYEKCGFVRLGRQDGMLNMLCVRSDCD